MALEFDINDIDLDNIGSWPNVVKVGVISIVCVFILAVGYWLNFKGQVARVNQLEKQERQLKFKFEAKQSKAANLEAYKRQLADIRKIFGVMLKQLPSRTEVPGLLEDITQNGRNSGLEFKLFDPSKEIEHEFYAELPIKISTVGDYHQLAEFVSQIAGLSRIVTMHNIKISPLSKLEKERLKKLNKSTGELLKMDITAKTYRYIDENPA